MTDIGLVLSMFSALAVLAVSAIIGAGFWARARAVAEDREFAYEMANSDAGGHGWLASDDD